MNECAYCGIDCKKCEYREKFNCSGCQSMKGNLCWGACEIAKCAMEKKIDHCGMCSNFPCELLKSFAYHETHGDNGERIRNIERIMNKEKV